MNDSGEPPYSAAGVGKDGSVAFVQAVLQEITWRKLAVAQALAMTLALIRYLRATQDPAIAPHTLQTHLIINAVGAFFVLAAAVATDQAAQRGLRASVAFPLALFAASAAAGVTQWYFRAWLGVLDISPNSGAPWAPILVTMADVAVLGGLAMMAYLQRENAQRVLERIRTAELARVQTERHLTESRLATMQAQIDPGVVLMQLAAIRQLYDDARLGADETLETFIQALRASVTRDAAGITAREMRR
jgi:hypothetical protein